MTFPRLSLALGLAIASVAAGAAPADPVAKPENVSRAAAASPPALNKKILELNKAL
jgi:hypothetical protein